MRGATENQKRAKQGRGRPPASARKTQSEPKATEGNLRDLVEELGVLVWEADPESLQFSSVSPSAENMLGYPCAQWLRESGFWVSHIHPEDRGRVVNACRVSVAGAAGGDFEYRMIAADGRQVWLRNILRLVRDENGRALRLQGLMLETTDSKRTEEALRESNQRLRLMVEQMPAILWSTDSQLRITSLAGRGLSNLDMRAAQLMGMSLHEYFQTDNLKFPPIAMHRRALQGESVSYELSWLERILQAYLEPLRDADGTIIGCLGVALDITDRKRAEEQARQLAVLDPLTGLANYRRFVDGLDAEIRRYGRTGRPFAVLLLDLDGLKRINDSYGHLVGSRALCRLANVLLVHCRETDIAARYGGDEFAMVLPETDAEAAGHVARRISEMLGKDGEKPRLSVSAGVAVYPHDGDTVERLLAAADRGLYGVKGCYGRRFAVLKREAPPSRKTEATVLSKTRRAC